MGRASSLQEISAAALTGLTALAHTPIAYTARLEAGVWTIVGHVGLDGDVAGVAVPEAEAPHYAALREGRTLCYEDAASMGPDLAARLDAVGLRALYAAPMMKDDECVGAVAIGAPTETTFTPRQRALTQLFAAHLSNLVTKRELLHSLEILAESVPVIVLRTEPSGWINWYNRRWYEYTGQTREEAAGWGWQTAHHPEDLLRVMEEWPKALATGAPIEIEFRLKRYDGEYRWHLANVDPVRDDHGTIVGWYGSVVDIEAQKDALERTKRVADALQEAFLPTALPSRPDLRLDAMYVSAEEDARVGGDWYDAFDLPDGRMVFSIGDVGGHGLSASITVGKLRQGVYYLSRLIDDPALILAELNRGLREQEPDTYVTAIVGMIERDGKTIRYASAGHPPPVLARRAGEPAVDLPTGGPPLGVLAQPAIPVRTIAVEPDMVLALYTDGMTEFGRDAVAGEARLRAAVGDLVGTRWARPAKVAYDTILDGQLPQDDAALLVLQFAQVDAIDPERPEGDTKQWRFHASDAKAVHVARREMGAFLRRSYGSEEAAFESELIVGELLANTVEHAPGLVHMTITRENGDHVLVVRDSGPGMAAFVATLPEDPMQEGQRGLFLVGSLSARVTVERSPQGGAELRVVLPPAP